MKRFTETAKWQDPWFRGLEPRLKCLWFYLCDACDAAGIIKIDWPLASFVIGHTVSENDLEKFDGRIEPIGDGYHWLSKFVAFQHRTLSPHSPPQRHVIELLERYGLTEKANGAYRKGKARVAKG